MLRKVEEEIGFGFLSASKFQKLGFKKYDKQTYKELEHLGKGAFGIVTKALEIRKREVSALKFVSLKDKSREKVFILVASLLVEKQILTLLRKKDNTNKYFPEFHGIFYILENDEEENEIKKLVLITEAGDFNLDEVKKIRKKTNQNYEKEELLHILTHLAEGYQILQELNIYHSDTKLSNFVLSKSKNSYLIIDFGLSIRFKKENNPNIVEVHNISYFVNGGTPKYCSPEKAKYLKNRKECSDFNPFRCDIWSLGICFKKLLGKNNSPKTKTRIWNDLAKMNEKKIEKRLDAEQLCSILKKENLAGKLNMLELEGNIIRLLESSRRMKEAFKELYEKYDAAQMPYELMRIASEENKNLPEKEKIISFQENIEIKERIGYKFLNKEKLIIN